MTDSERCAALEARCAVLEQRAVTNDGITRDLANGAARLGGIVDLVAKEVETHADKSFVDSLNDLTRNDVVPKLASLADRMNNQPKGRAAEILGAARPIWKDALGGNVKALFLLLGFSIPILILVIGIILALSGQLDDVIGAVRGTPETTIEAPNADVSAPGSTINP